MTAKLKILNVDDYAAKRYARTRILQRAGFDVLEAGTGEEALRIAKQERPIVVLLDVNLPDMMGFEVSRRLQMDPVTSSILIMHISSTNVQPSDRVLGLQTGAVGYVVEPVESDELVATINALVRLRHTQDALRAREEQLQLALESAHMTAFDWEIPGNRITRSSNARELLRLSPDIRLETLEDFLALVHPDDVTEWKQRMSAALEGKGAYEADYRFLCSDGSLLWLLERGNVQFDASGQALRVIGVAIDVTERRRVEEALKLTDRRKDEFLAMLAHELRNPLAPIQTAAQVLTLAGPDEAQSLHAREVILRQCNHLTRLIDDLLDVSRFTRGTVQLRLERVNIESVLNQAVETVQPLIEERRHELTIDVPGEELQVHGDTVRLVQIVGNLLANAAKYTPSGGKILLRAEAEGETISISVRDSGMGIPPELLEHVFDLFMQVNRGIDRSQGGLGWFIHPRHGRPVPAWRHDELSNALWIAGSAPGAHRRNRLQASSPFQSPRGKPPDGEGYESFGLTTFSPDHAS